jgi:hypothetical protein
VDRVISMTSSIPGRLPAVGLLVAIAASAGANAVASTSAPRLAHGPVVTFDRKHPNKGLIAYVRFTKEVARTSEGTPQVRLGLSAPVRVPVATAGTVGRRSRACYSVRLFAGLSHPKTGTTVRLVIETGSRSNPARRTVTVHLQGINKEPSRQSDNPVLQNLGCVNGR